MSRVQYVMDNAAALYQHADSNIEQLGAALSARYPGSVFPCCAGLDAEDLDTLDDTTGHLFTGDVPAAASVLLFLVGVDRADLFTDVDSPYELDRVGERWVRLLLAGLDAHARARGRSLKARLAIRTLYSNRPGAVVARTVVEECFTALMMVLYKTAQDAGLVPADRDATRLRRAYRTLFDTLGLILRGWADASLPARIGGKTPAELFGMLLADTWRSSLVYEGEEVGGGALKDAAALARLVRPPFWPLTLGEIFERGGKQVLGRILGQ